MAALDSKIIHPFMPSLFHLAVVEIAVPLFNEFDIKTLNWVFESIQHGNLGRLNGGSQKNRKAYRAMERFLSIPVHLRDRVLQAVRGMHWAVHRWKCDHYHLHLKNKDCLFCWRPDGTIDRHKTAQLLVVNDNIDTRQRFDIACMYCLVTSIQTLWEEMKASGRTEDFKKSNTFLTKFWLSWLEDGCRVPWLQALQAYPYSLRRLRFCFLKRFSSFFPLLQPKDRHKFLKFFSLDSSDDFRFCLYAATKEEEEQMLNVGVNSILILYLQWPLQSYFLETVEKLWRFMDISSLIIVLSLIQNCYKRGMTDFDYGKLYMDYWNRRPFKFRDAANFTTYFLEENDSFLNKIRNGSESRKRKAELDSHENQKIWKRENGRLHSVSRTL